jgi:hypothetical protein
MWQPTSNPLPRSLPNVFRIFPIHANGYLDLDKVTSLIVRSHKNKALLATPNHVSDDQHKSVAAKHYEDASFIKYPPHAIGELILHVLHMGCSQGPPARELVSVILNGIQL